MPDPLCYLEEYSRICLLVLKVDYPESVRERAREDSDYVRQIRERHYEAAKGRMLRGLLKIEEEIRGVRLWGQGDVSCVRAVPGKRENLVGIPGFAVILSRRWD